MLLLVLCSLALMSCKVHGAFHVYINLVLEHQISNFDRRTLSCNWILAMFYRSQCFCPKRPRNQSVGTWKWVREMIDLRPGSTPCACASSVCACVCLVVNTGVGNLNEKIPGNLIAWSLVALWNVYLVALPELVLDTLHTGRIIYVWTLATCTKFQGTPANNPH